MMSAAMLATLALAGCVEMDGDGQGSYTMRDQYREGITSVYVPMWGRGKNVYRRELEFRLTEAVVKRIELDTEYKVTDRSRADTELSGEIVTVEQSQLGFNPDTGNPRETLITMTLAFVWRDLRNGEELVREAEMTVSDTYIRDAPLGEDFFQGSQSLIERASKRIVERMETDWGVEDDAEDNGGGDEFDESADEPAADGY